MRSNDRFTALYKSSSQYTIFFNIGCKELFHSSRDKALLDVDAPTLIPATIVPAIFFGTDSNACESERRLTARMIVNIYLPQVQDGGLDLGTV